LYWAQGFDSGSLHEEQVQHWYFGVGGCFGGAFDLRDSR
jgi:hypothetical protein